MADVKKILICIDDSAYSIKVAHKGISLAKDLNADISLIHVVDNRTIVEEGESRKMEEITEKMITEARKLLFKMLDMFSCAAAIHSEVGNPGTVILKKSKQLGVDLIILGTHGKTGIKGLLMGSIAEEVIRHSKIPALVVPFKSIDKN